MRSLRKNRDATALSVLSFTLGVGLTTALFSVADALLLRPFLFRRPDGWCELSSLGDDGRPLRDGFLLAKDNGYDLVSAQATSLSAWPS